MNSDTSKIHLLTSGSLLPSDPRNSLKRYLRRKSLIRSSGPDEVENSITKLKNRIVILDRHSKVPTDPVKLLILRDFLFQLPENWSKLHEDSRILIGPNIELTDLRNMNELKKFKNAKFLLPSKWPSQVIADHTKIDLQDMFVWPCGVDTEYWKPKGQTTKDNVLLYLKDTTQSQDLKRIAESLANQLIPTRIIRYGSYTNREYRKELLRATSLIYFGDTESQGLAQFQSWAMDVPTLVVRKQEFNFRGKTYNSTSSPYISAETGMLTMNSIISNYDLVDFRNKSKLMSPRKWIIENATLEKSFESLEMLFRRFGSPSSQES